MENRSGAHRIFLGKPELKKPLERPRLRWEDNIKIDNQEVGCGSMDWIGLTQYRVRWQRVVSALKKYRFPYISENFLTNRWPVGISGGTVLHGVVKLVMWAR